MVHRTQHAQQETVTSIRVVDELVRFDWRGVELSKGGRDFGRFSQGWVEGR